MLQQKRSRLLVRRLAGSYHGRGVRPASGAGVLRAGREGFSAQERLVNEEYRDRLRGDYRGGGRFDVDERKFCARERMLFIVTTGRRATLGEW